MTRLLLVLSIALTTALAAGALLAESPSSYRMAAYRRALEFPYPPGIDTAGPKRLLQDAASRVADNRSLPQLERWFEVVSTLTDLEQETRYLEQFRSLRRNFGLSSALFNSISAAASQVTKSKRQANAMQLDAAEASLDSLRTELASVSAAIEKQIGARIWPDRQADPFTWLNAPVLQGFALSPGEAGSDHTRGVLGGEPTPYDIRWAGGPALCLAPAGRRFSVEHSWTGAVWRSGKMIVERSVFSPAIRVKGLASLDVPGGRAVMKLRHGVAIVDGAGWKLLIVTQAANVSAIATAGAVRLSLPPGSNSWLIPVKSATEADVWRTVLPKLPTGAVQLKRGDRITHYFTGGKNLVAPVPPMLQLALTARPGPSKRPPVHCRSAVKTPNGKWGTPIQPNGWEFQMPAAFVVGDSISYDLPAFPDHPLAGLRGINCLAELTTPEDIATISRDGARYLRMCITERPKDSFDEWFRHTAVLLEACRKHRVKVNVDPHFLGDEKEAFVSFWAQLARACAPYRDTIAIYDLRNEPPEHTGEQNEEWFRWAEKAGEAIRQIDPYTPILVECGGGGNPSGFPLLRKVNTPGVVYGFHLYYPHAFTHQACLNKEGPPVAPVKPFPSWVPSMNWKDDSWTEPAEWCDRWTLRGQCLPLYQWWIRNGLLPLDNGEFGVVGWAWQKLTPSATRWTRDVLRLNETLRASWTLYGYQGGFGWYEPIKPMVRHYWRTGSERPVVY